MAVTILVGDMAERLRELPDNSVDSCVCDPPYHLTSIVKRFGAENAAPAKAGKTGAFARASKGFMGQTWDGGDIAFRPETWAEVFRVLKPGGFLLAFSATRTYHRMAVAIEDAGFDVRDMIAWTYGTGFPKSHNISKAITAREKHGSARTTDIRKLNMGDEYTPSGRGRKNYDNGGGSKMSGSSGQPKLSETAREWEGWGTALKPSQEPICVAQKPISEKTIAANVLKWGTGALNIDGCRIEAPEGSVVRMEHRETDAKRGYDGGIKGGSRVEPQTLGRWPANLCHDGSEDVLAGFPSEAGGSGKASGPTLRDGNRSVARGKFNGLPDGIEPAFYGDSGSAARFFYCAKAGKLDRLGSDHPTVKPVALMRWLVRLVTPPGGTILDPFAGTGSTGVAAFVEGFDATLVELREEAADDIRRRIDHIQGLGRMTALELATSDLKDEKKAKKARGGDLPLFAEPDE